MQQYQYWVQHDELVWTPGTQVSQDDKETVFSATNGDEQVEVRVPAAKVKELEPILDGDTLKGVPDICRLSSITEASLLHAVRLRYDRDEIYTNISSIVVAVNPFKQLPIYSGEYVEKYRLAKDMSSMPPHVFGICANAFSGLSDTLQSQAVLISGESGAGKTESTKLVLLYASEVLKCEQGGFEDKILEINPVLEAFGNAKTVRNNNSSRFGKWIEVSTNPGQMSLVGASVTDYLLEVTRVIGQGPGERNYHIFYQLVNNCVGPGFEHLKLEDKDKFAFINRNPIVDPTLNDEEDFNMLKKALISLRFDQREQDCIFRVVSAVLHLGNIEFVEDGAGSKPVNAEAFPLIAEMLECNEAQLAKCILCKRLTVGKDVTESPLDKDKARQARDAVAKIMYSRLFSWLVIRCNEALQLGGEEIDAKAPYIGVLDIAGFESFETNMLEQLFINLSNEKLQQFFNNNVFKTELSEYEKEGIDVGKISFSDNADVLMLIEGKGGLLSMLDDSTTGVKQTDTMYTNNIVKAHEKHARFVKPKFTNSTTFSIKHFAGVVTYTSEGFLLKNFSSQPAELLELMAASQLPVLQALAAGGQDEANAGGSKAGKKATVSMNFRKSLNQLIEKLQTAKAHFVRCVKPNNQKVPNKLSSVAVFDQLRLSGIMDAVRIRKSGYPLRQPVDEFIKRYLIIIPKGARKRMLEEVGATDGKITPDNAQKLSALTLQELQTTMGSKMSAEDSVMGKTKVFMKEDFQRNLEYHRRLACAAPALQIQSFFRGFILRKSLKEARPIYKELQLTLAECGFASSKNLDASSAIEKLHRATAVEGSQAKLQMHITRAELLPLKLAPLQQALKVSSRLAAESALARSMQNHVTNDSMDAPAMQALLARSTHYHMKGELVDKISERCAIIQKQLPFRRILQNCAVHELEDMEPNLEKVRGAGLDKAENWLIKDGFALYEQAIERQKVLIEEERLRLEAIRLEEERLAEVKRLEEEAKRMEEEARLKAEEEAAEALRKAKQAEADAKEARLKMEEERRAKEALEAEKRAKEIVEIKARIEKAALAFSAKELEEVFRQADQIGMPQEDYAATHKLFLDLQNGVFVQAKVAELQKSSSGEQVNIVALNNLYEQLAYLGVKVPQKESRVVSAELMARVKSSRRPSVFDNCSPDELQVVKNCFEDLSNFSRLRDPSQWGSSARGHNRAGLQGVATAMLRYSPDRIAKPLTQLDTSFELVAVRNFGDLLRCMGDKPSVYTGDKEQPVINTAKRGQALCDEVYVQVMKQLTGNPSTQSERAGWKLLKGLTAAATPSDELCEFLRAFLNKAITTIVKDEDMPESDDSEKDDEEEPAPPPARLATRLRLPSEKMRAVSTVSIMEKMDQNWVMSRKAFLTARPKIASETLELFVKKLNDKASASPAGAQEPGSSVTSVVVTIYTEDGMTRPLKVKPTQTLGQLHQRVMKLVTLNTGDRFEFFAHLGDTSPMTQLLPRDMEITRAAVEIESAGLHLFFARVHLVPGEDLPADDFQNARLTFLHAGAQFLQYTYQPGADESQSAGAVTEIAAALVSTDQVIYRKKRRGRLYAKFNQKVASFQKDIDGGLVGETVLERYIPASQLGSCSREDWARRILERLRTQRSPLASAAVGGEEDEGEGSHALIAQSRAVEAMLQLLPDFGCYSWGPVVQAEEAAVWEETGSSLCRCPVTRPRGTFRLSPSAPDAQYRFLMKPDRIELRPMGPDQKAIHLPMAKGNYTEFITGWRPLPGDLLAVSVAACEAEPTGAEPRGRSHVSFDMVLRVPPGAANSISAFMARHDGWV